MASTKACSIWQGVPHHRSSHRHRRASTVARLQRSRSRRSTRRRTGKRRSTEEDQTMDQEVFDDLTRSVASGVGTRRQALRALSGTLLGGAFGGVAARIGLGDVTAAKATKHQAKRKDKRGLRAERKEQGQLQAQGSGKG